MVPGRRRNGLNATVSSHLKIPGGFPYIFTNFLSILPIGKCPNDEITGLTISANCKRNRKSFPCSGHLKSGTKAYISCRSGYLEPTSGVIPELTCLESGQWDLEAHKCEADCGVILKGGLLTFVNILVKFPNASSNFRRKH